MKQGLLSNGLDDSRLTESCQCFCRQLAGRDARQIVARGEKLLVRPANLLNRRAGCVHLAEQIALSVPHGPAQICHRGGYFNRNDGDAVGIAVQKLAG